jgi:hypothetical protein
MKETNFVTIAVIYGELQASVLKGRLESEGIPVFLQYESVGRITPVLVDGLGEIKVKVPEEFAEEAKQILEQPPSDSSYEQI